MIKKLIQIENNKIKIKFSYFFHVLVPLEHLKSKTAPGHMYLICKMLMSLIRLTLTKSIKYTNE